MCLMAQVKNNTPLVPAMASHRTDDEPWWRHQIETFYASLAICAGIHRSPVNSPHKGQWRGALMFSLICVWINGWVNKREAGDLRRYRAHYDVSVMTNSCTKVAQLAHMCSEVQWTWWTDNKSHPHYMCESCELINNIESSFLCCRGACSNILCMNWEHG